MNARSPTPRSAAPQSESPRAERARALLHQADGHLSQARMLLGAMPPDYAAALDDELAVFRTSLRAFLAWEGSAEAARED